MIINNLCAGTEMAVRAYTDRPEALLSTIKKQISAGGIVTWTIDSDGDLTHSAKQWAGRAWMRPRILEDRLLFNIIAPSNQKMSKTVYGVYHGRLTEMLLTHFDNIIETVVATAAGTSGDQF